MSRVALSLGILLAITGITRANQGTPTTPELLGIRISVALVQVDAVVTDSKGRHVTDLQSADFVLEENGKPQKVTNVAYVQAQGPAASRSADAGARSHEPSPGPAGRTLVFVVDDLGLSARGMVGVRQTLRGFAAEPLGPGDRVALLTTGAARHWLSPSGDRQALARAAEALRHNLTGSLGAPSTLRTDLSPEMATNRFASDTIAETPDEIGGSATSAALALVQQRVAALLGTIDALRAWPGRKAIVFLSEGFSLTRPRNRDLGLQFFDGLYGASDAQAVLRTLVDVANRASVVLYTVDPRGLTMPRSHDNLQQGPRAVDELPALQSDSDRLDTQSQLKQLAEQTGGFAFLNSNDLGSGVRQILADQAGYYLIGYEPGAATFESRSGKPHFQTVKVKVKRSGLKVRSRAGFYGLTDEEVARKVPAPKVD